MPKVVTNPRLRDAIVEIMSGNRVAGRKILAHLLRLEPNNEAAWLWLAVVMDTRDDKEKCLTQALRISPDSEQVNRALYTLKNSVGLPGVELVIPPMQEEFVPLPRNMHEAHQEEAPPNETKAASNSMQIQNAGAANNHQPAPADNIHAEAHDAAQTNTKPQQSKRIHTRSRQQPVPSLSGFPRLGTGPNLEVLNYASGLLYILGALVIAFCAALGFVYAESQLALGQTYPTPTTVRATWVTLGLFAGGFFGVWHFALAQLITLFMSVETQSRLGNVLLAHIMEQQSHHKKNGRDG